ncbi:3-keto-5-aminohexanoate cleavage protein, partial [Mesorhizobium sp. BHbsci]
MRSSTSQQAAARRRPVEDAPAHFLDRPCDDFLGIRIDLGRRYDVGHLYNVAYFADVGLLKPPFIIQTVFGFSGGIGV